MFYHIKMEKTWQEKNLFLKEYVLQALAVFYFYMVRKIDKSNMMH